MVSSVNFKEELKQRKAEAEGGGAREGRFGSIKEGPAFTISLASPLLVGAGTTPKGE